MTYSVYILYSEDDVWGDPVGALGGDVDLGEHMANAGMSAVGDLIGLDFYDRYANKLTHEKSVALTGEMVSDVKINTSLIKREVYKITYPGEEANTLSKTVTNTVTVKGRLLMPPASFLALNKYVKSVSKKKDTSKIWEWANQPLTINDEANPEYYRKVLITVYANTDQQFRAYILRDAFVDSYEENFDSNGDGTFTLVMKEVILNKEAFEVQGPSFDATALSVISQIDTAVSKVADNTEKVTEAVEVFVTDSQVTQAIKTYAGGAKDLSQIVDSNVVDGDLSVSNLADSATNYTKTTKDLIDTTIDLIPKDDDDDGEKKDSDTKPADTSNDYKMPDPLADRNKILGSFGISAVDPLEDRRKLLDSFGISDTSQTPATVGTSTNDTTITDTTINDMMNNILNGNDDDDGDDSN